MAAEIIWENNKQPNQEGLIVAIIRQPGRRDERYVGKTIDEVAEKALEGKAAADERISKQSKKLRELTPAPKPAADPNAVKPMDAGERMALSVAANDPAHFHEPIERVVETSLGMPLAEVRRRLQAQTEAEEDARWKGEGQRFARENPEYYSCPVNDRALISWLQLERREPTAENLALAFSTLKDENALVPRPAQEQTPPTRGQRDNASSGMRPSDAGARPAPRVSQQEQYTAEQIQAMSQNELGRRLGDPKFAAMVDRVLAKPAKK